VAEAATLRAEHHHDWGYTSEKARWKMISSARDPFTADNNYSYLSLRDAVTGAELFRRPVPALTYIWISPDLRYVVGLSHIMLWNPYQLVVFSKSGDRLLERDMVGVDWPGVKRSASNWITGTRSPRRRSPSATTGPLPRSRSKIRLGLFVNFSSRQPTSGRNPRAPSSLIPRG
jgi:hypothetical protein